ncbi:hypothetical protein [Selenomonas ruminantium]|uniref:hypothetical protein n=1 Tax=Selenomonas ruminantium TaxID=971 RepID=UPI0026EF9320|nr:hypothetical protein [Selenomonas ruminantium]
MRVEQKLLSIEELEALLDEWQSRLCLTEWDIALKIARRSEFGEEDNQGDIIYNKLSAQAIIRILDPIDWDNALFNQDMEKALVHELLHLMWHDFEPAAEESREHVLWHRRLETTARIMVMLKRSGLAASMDVKEVEQ